MRSNRFSPALSPALGLALFLAPALAFAEDAKPTAPAAPAPQTAAPVLSQSKFLSQLYSEISKRTPDDTAAGPGEVQVSFHVNAQGKIDKVTIEKTSSPAHAEIVKKILGSVQGPPPPGGSEDISQVFRFR